MRCPLRSCIRRWFSWKFHFYHGAKGKGAVVFGAIKWRHSKAKLLDQLTHELIQYNIVSKEEINYKYKIILFRILDNSLTAVKCDMDI